MDVNTIKNNSVSAHPLRFSKALPDLSYLPDFDLPAAVPFPTVLTSGRLSCDVCFVPIPRSVFRDAVLLEIDMRSVFDFDLVYGSGCYRRIANVIRSVSGVL